MCNWQGSLDSLRLGGHMLLKIGISSPKKVSEANKRFHRGKSVLLLVAYSSREIEFAINCCILC
jgi:uncharacterized protein (DUF952 family)